MITTTGMLLLCAALGLLHLLIRLRRNPENTEWQPNARHPYISREEFLPAQHGEFMYSLQRAVSDIVDVCPRVAANDVVKTINQLPKKEWRYWKKHLLNFSFDFVLMDRKDRSIVCAIDLHKDETIKVLGSDYVRDLCHAARIPFVRFQASGDLDVSAIRSVILAHLPPTTDTEKIASTSTTQEIGLICPKCSSLLVRKVARRGVYAGNEFWACSSAPRCRHAEPVTT